MVKAVALALALSFLLWVFFYLPKRLKKGSGARFRFVVFSAFALAFAFFLLKVFLWKHSFGIAHSLILITPRQSRTESLFDYFKSPMHIRAEQDYYAILGVPPSATSVALRAAYRSLAKRRHPDVALDEASRQEDFSLINEAYEVLSHPRQRAQYDELRLVLGVSRPGRKPLAQSSQELLTQAEQLRLHMQQIDKMRMNHEALCDYVLDLLQEEHLQCLATHPEHRRQIFECVFESIQGISPRLIPELIPVMNALAGADAALLKQWDDWVRACVQERRWNQYRPLIVILCSALICLVLWWLARR